MVATTITNTRMVSIFPAFFIFSTVVVSMTLSQSILWTQVAFSSGLYLGAPAQVYIAAH